MTPAPQSVGGEPEIDDPAALGSSGGMEAGPGRFLERERPDLTAAAISNGELSVNEMRLWLISVAAKGGRRRLPHALISARKCGSV